MDDGVQAGLHSPKVGCWACLEAFLDAVREWVEEDGHCSHGGKDVTAAFATWAEGQRIAHGQGDAS